MTAEPRVERCRSCGAEVFWAQWRGPGGTTGGWMPVDAVPDGRSPHKGGGDVVLSLSRSTGQLTVEKWRAEHGEKRNRYTSHFATCPDAKGWRR